EKLRREANVVARLHAIEEPAKASCPKLLEMGYIGCLFRRGFIDAHLNAPRISDSAVEKTNAPQHRRDECELVFESAIDHFLSRVPMRKIAVEMDAGKLPHEANCPPHVLKMVARWVSTYRGIRRRSAAFKMASINRCAFTSSSNPQPT